jgi:hypothetical protein
MISILNAMEEICQKYKQQVNKAKETVALIEDEMYQIRLKLQKDPNNAVYLQELKNTTLDMTITLNELEHSQNAFEQCMSKHSNVK